MAENKGKTKGAIMSAVQSAQTAVGSAITGAQGAVAGDVAGGSQSIPLLEDLRDIGKENEKNTESLLAIFKSMFSWDKEQAARLRDQLREQKQEAVGPQGPGLKGDIGELKEAKGIPGVLAAAAALTALAAFARGTNLEDIIRLPGQLKGIKGMATFAKGVTKIGTLGLGAKFLDNATDSLKLFKTNFITRLGELKASALTKFKDIKMPAFTGLATKFKELDFVKKITNSKAYALAVSSLNGIKTGIANVIAPMKNAFASVFGAGGGGPAGAGGGGGQLSKILAPLRAIGRVIGKLFLPITLIMGIFDGYTGFMEEYEKEQSFVDGIRGAVTGIVDGFIGGLVRLVTNVIGWMLEKLGLDHMADAITQFGEDATGAFKTAVGGLVDIVTGIFTLDLERIWGGIKGLAGGTANFLFDTITLPINMAVNFVKDLFGWGDPDKPFNLKSFIFGGEGEEGLLPGVWNWFKGIFNFDSVKEKWAAVKNKFFDMGKTFKAIVAASAAAVKAGWPGGESPAEAYKRVFEEMTAGSGNMSGEADVKGEDIAKTTVTNVKGDTTETTYKTETVSKSGDLNNGTTVVYTDNSNKQVSNSTVAKNETYTGPLHTGSDPYYDREAWNSASG